MRTSQKKAVFYDPTAAEIKNPGAPHKTEAGKQKPGAGRRTAPDLSSQQPIDRYMQRIGQRTQLPVRYGPLLPLQQRQGRDAHIHAGQLQLCKQLDLLHPAFAPGLCDPCADKIFCTKLQFPRIQANTPASEPIIRKGRVDIFGITKYNKFNTVKYGACEMEYVEVRPLPDVCRNCEDRRTCLAKGEPEWCCDECDYLLERFVPVCTGEKDAPVQD